MIPVIWYNQSFGNWDSGLLHSIFEKHPDKFIQYNELPNPVFHRAIVIIVGKPNAIEVRHYLAKMKSGIVILTSEEDAFFNWQLSVPENLEVWTQYYSPTTKQEITERLLLGAPLRMRDYKINKHLPKKYLWSFVGQVQNPFRQACVDVLKTLPDGFLHVADAFGGEKNGIEYQEYLDIMCQSYYVICPAGSMCVDSFRLYEAIECGAIPITDGRSPRDSEDFHYWDEVTPSSHGILSLMPEKDFPGYWHKWDDVKDFLIKQKMPPHVMIDQNDWWIEYKQQLENKLLKIAL